MATARVRIDGAEFVFRPPTLAEAEEFLAGAEPGAFAARLLVEGDPAALARAADARPLALGQSVLPRLFALAATAREARGKRAVARWRSSETHLGRMAESLLAFKAYDGSEEPSEATIAGALHVAEWLDSTRGVFRLLHSLIKGLSRGRRG